MNKTKLDFYKESGIAAPLNTALVIFCSLITILFFSYFYSLIINYLPIIYFNIILVIVYGFIISYVSRLFNIIFKIRNRMKSIIITIILSIFAVYFQWVSYLYIISSENFSLFMVFEDLGFFFKILFRPDLVLNNILDINKVGLWSIGTSGIHLNGLFLWLIWLAEAAIIIYVSVKKYTTFNLIPFSEKNNKWFKKEVIDFDFEHIALGSCSLKNCLIAEGGADCYLRIGVTGEWDTGASQCILEQAGGSIIDSEFNPLSYNKRESLLNPDFLSLGNQNIPWQEIIKPHRKVYSD